MEREPGSEAGLAARNRFTRRRGLLTGGIGLASGALAAARVSNPALAQTAAATPAADVSANPGVVTPERVDAAVTAIDAMAQQLLAKSGVPGLAMAIVFQDKVVHLAGYGLREAGKSDKVDPDTVFQLASVSKAISSTVVATLVSDGKLTWDSRIGDLDPGFAMFDPLATQEVTVRDLFAHRSGLPDHAGDELEDIGYDRAEVLHRLRFLKPSSSFRSAYAYTNFGLTEAVVAAAKAADAKREDVAETLLFKPLGMTNTSSHYAALVAATNRAHLHVLVDGAYIAKYERDADAQSPAGGVSSTVRDLAQWMRLQLGAGAIDGHELIKAEALGETHRPQIVSKRPVDPAVNRAGFYGLGWEISYDEFGSVRLNHSGGFALGASTAVYLLPGAQLGIVALTNSPPVGLPEAIGLSFLDLVQTGKVTMDYFSAFSVYLADRFTATYGTAVDFSKPPSSPVAALAFDAYLGVYENDYYGNCGIVAADGGLELHLGPKPMTFALTHFDRDVFSYQPVGENAFGPSAVIFAVDETGAAASVVIENLDLNHQGRFTRKAD